MGFGDWELIPLRACGGDLGDPLDFIGVEAEITDREGYPAWQSFYWDGSRQPFIDINDFDPLTTTTVKRHGWTCRMNGGDFVATKVYPQPAGVATTSRYVVSVQGESSFVYTSGHGQFTSFEAGGSGGIDVVVTTDTNYSAPVVRPTDDGVTVTKTAANTYTFTLPGTGQYSFEPVAPVTETPSTHPLFLFVNPPEYMPPLASTATIRVLTPGVWSVDTTSLVPVAGVTTGTAGEYSLPADRRIHIMGGAYLRGKIKVGSNTEGGANANNSEITGYGIVDATAVSDRGRPLRVNNTDGCWIDGPTFLGQKAWACAVRKSNNVVFQNVKVLNWRDNDGTGTPDGIDLVASTNCQVGYSFIRAYDDPITVKSSMDDNTWQGASADHIFHHLVLFNGDAGNGMEIGFETQQPIARIYYQDIVVLHKFAKTPTYERDAISINNRDAGAISDIVYERITIEECQERYIGIQATGGSITNVMLRDITFFGAPKTLPIVITGTVGHLVTNVNFVRVKFNAGATPVASAADIALTTNAYATGITYSAT